MPKSENQKLKILYIAKFFEEFTDEEHPAFAKDIEAYLNDKGIKAEIHSIGRDIALLRDELGMDILGGYGKPFFLASRPFDDEELHALSVGVASSKYLTKKKASAIVDKVAALGSVSEREAIRSRVFAVDRVRNENERIFTNISEVSRAISTNSKISISYLSHSISENNRLSQKEKKFKISPLELFYNEGVYYLFAYAFGKVLTFRLDRMKSVVVLDERGEGSADFALWDLKTYPKRAFNMFGDKADNYTAIEIVFENNLLNSVVDRFSTTGEVRYSWVDKKHFKLGTRVYVSKMFFAWLCQFGNQAKLISPDSVVEQFKEYLTTIENQY